MDIKPIHKNAENKTQEKLQGYYANQMISAEKKNYLTLHEQSIGPYLAVEDEDGKPCYLQDAASQIATLGLGFNSSTFMGTAHQLCSWVNRTDTQEYEKVRSAFDNLMARSTQWPNTETTICNSGAEANEIALGFCYSKRVNKDANKVLAFEGSFHGRMLVSLASTWNKSKREPFQLPGFETEYCEAPALSNDEIEVDFPKDWIKKWDDAVKRDFECDEQWSEDALVDAEVKSLLSVREKLLSGTIFAIIIEPMQCEGGDRYLSNRFHSALIAMADSFKVPIIHDEVQTGFHLGRKFFWHVDLNLHDDFHNPLYPTYVTCAKKAQVGLVLSHNKENFQEQFHVASLLRGYLHGMALDQNSGKIDWLEEESRQQLTALINKYSEHISSPRVRGLSFAFDINDQEKVATFIEMRFEHGLLYYPAGSNTLRFRINTAYKVEDLNFLFKQLDIICDRIYNNAPALLPEMITTPDRDIDDLYFWQKNILKSKLGPSQDLSAIAQDISSYFSQKHGLKFELIDAKNFADFKDAIIELEKNTYELTRQTDISKFELAAHSRVSACMALTDHGKLVAIAFSSSLSDHPHERGVRRDHDYSDPNTLYMIDTTVESSYQGKGLGRKLKYALSIIAAAKGIRKISGRNRDRLAGSMLNINLSLGAIETDYVREDYLDDLPFRDVIYYETPLRWGREQMNFSDGINSPLSFDNLTPEFVERMLSSANNKVCLSNFVNTDFLDEVKTLFEKQPQALQHGYTASGQSECVDKITKSIWFNSDKDRHKMLTFKGQYFGSGSFMSRSLSDHSDPFFPVDHLDNPHYCSSDDSLNSLEKSLATGEYLALWLEPVEQHSFKRLDESYLEKVRQLCDEHNVALVYNETASSCYRYNGDNFFCANNTKITPDASMTFTGGQFGFVNINDKYFIAQPLMMISTWDGDEFSLSKYLHAVKAIESNKELFLKNRKEFEIKLRNKIELYRIQDFTLSNGCGSFKGNIPKAFAQYFHRHGDKYLINPNYSDLKSFISLGDTL